MFFASKTSLSFVYRLDAQEGIALLRSELKLIREHKILIRADIDAVKQRQVVLISGGGSGHEYEYSSEKRNSMCVNFTKKKLLICFASVCRRPAHAGYIGDAALGAVVCGSFHQPPRFTCLCGSEIVIPAAAHSPSHFLSILGEIFSSPSQEAIYAAIKACAGPHGVLLIVKNYTGDKINFRLAAERARFNDNILVETVIVADDVALLTEADDTSRAASVGARGLAGVVLVHKYAGSLASLGLSLQDIARRAQDFSNSTFLWRTPKSVPVEIHSVPQV